MEKDVTQMDDAQLDRAIQGEDTIVPEAPQQEVVVEEPEGEGTPPEPTTQDVQPPPEDAPPEEGEQPPPDPVAEAEKIRQDYEKLKEQIREKELMLQRQANELGVIRRMAMQPRIDPVKVREEIREQFQTDPELAARRLKALEQWEEERRRDQIDMVIPDLPELRPVLPKMLKNDGVPQELIDRFMADPKALPIQILERVAYAARAFRHDEARNAEVAALRKQLQQQQQNPSLSAPQGAPTIRASSPGGTSSTLRDANRYSRIGERDISGMSDAELDEFLAKNRGK